MQSHTGGGFVAAAQLAQGAAIVMSGIVTIVATQNSDWTMPGFVLIVTVLVLPLVIRLIVARRRDDPED